MRNILNHPRRGMALVLVLVVIGLAAVLGYAMLSSASLQQQTSHNLVVTGQAEYLAESGANLAVYYLQYPEYAPGGPYASTGNYWTGTGGPIGFASDVEGTIDVTVTRDPANRWAYDIVSVGRASSDPASPISRTTRCRVYVETRCEFPYAATFVNDVALPSQTNLGDGGGTNGTIYSLRSASMRVGGRINGVGWRKIMVTSGGTPSGGWRTPLPFKPYIVPTSIADIRSYRTYRMGTGSTLYTAGSIAGGSTLNSDLEPTASNPAGVYYAEGDLTINSNITVDGTLIVLGTLKASASGITIRSQDGFPALVVQKSIDMTNLLTASLRVEGLTWVGERILGGNTLVTSLVPQFETRGALIVCGTSPVFATSLLASFQGRREPDKIDVPDFTEIGRMVTGVKIENWSTSN